MNLESLANELLLDVFECLDTVDLLRAFHGLNSRFDDLLSHDLGACHLDFRSLSKHDFDIVCQQHLPSIIDRVISLHLSDDDETPTLPELFLSYGFTLNRFHHLRSVSLYCIVSLDILNQITSNCRHLPCLTHFRMSDCDSPYGNDELEFASLMNNIWSLPKLTHCIVDCDFSTKWLRLGCVIWPISMISPSIEHLSIKDSNRVFENLTRVFKYTPNIRWLCTTVSCFRQLERSFPSLISLKTDFFGTQVSMMDLLRNTPNLCYLTLRTADVYLNGHEWQNILVEYLPKVKIFRLKMDFRHYHEQREKEIDELLATFSTHFWIEERRWFVRCDWGSCFDIKSSLYTLPYAFDTYTLSQDEYRSKSTCPNETDNWLYDRVNTLELRNSNLLCARFSNIRHLKIQSPFSERFWSLVPCLHHCSSLEVKLHDSGFACCQLQELLDRAPHLTSLKLDIAFSSKSALLRITSTSIRRLEIGSLLQPQLGGFTLEGYTAFASSSLGRHCKILVIGLKDWKNAANLIEKTPELRSLIFQYEDNKLDNEESSSTNDIPVKWLRNHLPSTYSIDRDSNNRLRIRKWID